MKALLRNYLPFLRKEYRALKKSELNKAKVFNELFPDEEIDFSKLRAVYKYQQL